MGPKFPLFVRGKKRPDSDMTEVADEDRRLWEGGGGKAEVVPGPRSATVPVLWP